MYTTTPRISKNEWVLFYKIRCEITIVNQFCVRHQNRQGLNQHSKLPFFKINLHFGISDKTSTCGKLIFLPINSIFLVFSSLEIERRFIQTKKSTFYIRYHHNNFTMLLVPKVQKKASTSSLFLTTSFAHNLFYFFSLRMFFLNQWNF